MLDQRSSELLAGFLHSLHNNIQQVLMFKSATGRYYGFSPSFQGGGAAPPYHYTFETIGPALVLARVRLYRQISVKLNVPFEFRNVPVPE
jgi:hypothetical protein